MINFESRTEISEGLDVIEKQLDRIKDRIEAKVIQEWPWLLSYQQWLLETGSYDD